MASSTITPAASKALFLVWILETLKPKFYFRMLPSTNTFGLFPFLCWPSGSAAYPIVISQRFPQTGKKESFKTHDNHVLVSLKTNFASVMFLTVSKNTVITDESGIKRSRQLETNFADNIVENNILT